MGKSISAAFRDFAGRGVLGMAWIAVSAVAAMAQTPAPGRDGGTLDNTAASAIYNNIGSIIGMMAFMAVFAGLYVFIRNQPAEGKGKKARRR